MAVEAVSGLLKSYLEHGDNFTIPDMPDLPGWYKIEPEPELAFVLWLRSIRKSRNMTLADTADKMGVKRLSQNFSFWESNLEIRSFARLKA